MKKLLFPALIFGIFFVTGCYYDNEEELYPQTTCDTTNVTFSGTVQPIIDQYCISCHSGAGPSGGLQLENYSQISSNANNILTRISLPADDPALMPPGQKLDECTVLKIQKWIEEGTPNN